MTDLETAFAAACKEIGCEQDNEALLRSISRLKQEMNLLQSQLRNCHLEIDKLRNALLMAGVEHS